LEGLEAVELLYSRIKDDLYRIDSEFYKKIYLAIIEKFHKLESKELISVIKNVQHPAEIIRVYQENGIQILLAQNVRNNKFDFSTNVFMDSSCLNVLFVNKMDYDDVALTRSGANFGQSACFKENLEIYACADLLVLRNSGKIKGGYLSTFLNTLYGKHLLKRGSYGMAQPHIAPNYLNKFPIVRFSNNFENNIDKFIINSKYNFNKSQVLYSQAETRLLETLGLKDFNPSKDPVNVKSYKESFLATGRLDAEYYQKKYEEIVALIKKQSQYKLSHIVNIKKSIEPGSDVYSDAGIPFIRVSDYNKYGLSKPDKYLSLKYYSEHIDLIDRLKPKKETILFSKDGSLGLAYMLRKDEDFITSGAILHLTVKDKKFVIPEYLTLVLNSFLVQMQAERDSGGSIIVHWRIKEIEDVVIPIIDYTKQQEIANLVEESFRLKNQSEELLEIAKLAVEKAIEENEEKAMDFINQEIKRIGVVL
jgi:restriction endonuclease S subunit